MEQARLEARVDELLALKLSGEGVSQLVTGNELYPGALTVLAAVYGPESAHAKALRDTAEEVRNRKHGTPSHNILDLNAAALGALKNLKAELSSGLAGSLQKRLTGDVLTDLVQLARAVLAEPGEGAKNVAAVLAAAAFEDTIRRMGSTLAGVLGRDDLSSVIDGLKLKGVLQPPQLGIALSYLNFRNRALHADWGAIERASVESVLGFTEQMLLRHFS